MTPVRLEPAALWSRVKHSTTEPLRSLLADVDLKYFRALVADPTPALKSLTCLQTVENDIELLT